MPGCYRCELVVNRTGDPVGVCQMCGALACQSDGERDRHSADFICGMCDPSRLMTSGGLGPPPPPGPKGPPGPPGPGKPPVPSGGGAAAYASAADFERRRPAIAEQSYEHRQFLRRSIDKVLSELLALRDDEKASALATVVADELDPHQVAATAASLGEQVHQAKLEGNLDEELLADAFGVALWSIGAEPGEEPTVHQLSHLSDERIQLVVGRILPRAVPMAAGAA